MTGTARHVGSQGCQEPTVYLPPGDDESHAPHDSSWRLSVRRYVCPKGHEQHRSPARGDYRRRPTERADYFCTPCFRFYGHHEVVFLDEGAA